MNFPKMFGNWRDGAAPLGAAGRQSLPSPVNATWSAVAAAGQGDESIGKGPQEVNTEWKARVEHQDEVL